MSRECPSDYSEQGGILGTEALQQLVKTTDFVFPRPERIDAVSFDIHLGTRFIKASGKIVLGHQLQANQINEFIIEAGGSLVLQAGEFLLGETAERFNIPDNLFGLLETNGTPARAGVIIEFDLHVDPGFKGPFTLQIKNHRMPNPDIKDDGVVEIPIGYPVGRMHVLTVVGKTRPYGGKYGDANGPTIPKP